MIRKSYSFILFIRSIIIINILLIIVAVIFILLPPNNNINHPYSNINNNSENWQKFFTVVKTKNNNYSYDDWNIWTGYNISIFTWWKKLDPNCNIDDIIIWNQVWAWCNSTLWKWFEWLKQNNGNNIYIWNCYNYDGINNPNDADCYIWSKNMISNSSAKIFFDLKQPDWTNLNFDGEYNTIWWKLYTWTNSSSACPKWWHIPSDFDWEELEIYLNWKINCRNSTIWWMCDWLWWKWHSNKNNTNNLANALKLPLAGYMHKDGKTFHSRGRSTLLWSNTSINNSAYARYLHWNNSTIFRKLDNKKYWFSVRCLKN